MNSSALNISHVIFDMDGVLLDSEKYYMIARRKIAKNFDKTFSIELNQVITGRPSADSAEYVIRELDLPLSKEEFLTLFTQECEQLFQQRIPLIPGAERLVRHLHKNRIPIAIATSSKRCNFDLKTRFYPELFSLFDHILISPEEPEIVCGKPDPSVFLLCARRFKNVPTNLSSVLVFEDSISGIYAASFAGMNSVWLPDSATRSSDASNCCKPTQQIDSLLDFKPELYGLPPFDE